VRGDETMFITISWLFFTLFKMPASSNSTIFTYQDPIYTQIDPWIDQLHHHNVTVRQVATEALINLAHQSPELADEVLLALSLVLADRRWQNPLRGPQQTIWTDLIQLIARLPPNLTSIMLLIDELDHAVWQNGCFSYPAVKALIQIGPPAYVPVKMIFYRSTTPRQRLLAQQIVCILSTQYNLDFYTKQLKKLKMSDETILYYF
jgi:hypothetical protein